MLRRLLLIVAITSLAFADAIDISSEEFVEFRPSAQLWIEYPYPDLQFLDNLQPATLYWFIAGHLPSLPTSSYEFSATLQSIDGNSVHMLPNSTGAPTTLCLDSTFTCNVSEPGIILIFQYSDALGLTSLVGANDEPGLPALRLLVRNEGPSILLGVSGTTLQGFGLTWGNVEGKGVVTPATQFLLVDVPEPSTMSLMVLGLTALLVLSRAKTWRA
jgi:hypothetical protein